MKPKKTYGRMVTGELITDERVEKLAAEAERGWDVEDLLRRDAEAKAAQAADARGRTAPPRRPRRRR